MSLSERKTSFSSSDEWEMVSEDDPIDDEVDNESNMGQDDELAEQNDDIPISVEAVSETAKNKHINVVDHPEEKKTAELEKTYTGKEIKTWSFLLKFFNVELCVTIILNAICFAVCANIYVAFLNRYKDPHYMFFANAAFIALMVKVGVEGKEDSCFSLWPAEKESRIDFWISVISSTNFASFMCTISSWTLRISFDSKGFVVVVACQTVLTAAILLLIVFQPHENMGLSEMREKSRMSRMRFLTTGWVANHFFFQPGAALIKFTTFVVIVMVFLYKMLSQRRQQAVYDKVKDILGRYSMSDELSRKKVY